MSRRRGAEVRDTQSNYTPPEWTRTNLHGFDPHSAFRTRTLPGPPFCHGKEVNDFGTSTPSSTDTHTHTHTAGNSYLFISFLLASDLFEIPLYIHILPTDVRTVRFTEDSAYYTTKVRARKRREERGICAVNQKDRVPQEERQEKISHTTPYDLYKLSLSSTFSRFHYHHHYTHAPPVAYLSYFNRHPTSPNKKNARYFYIFFTIFRKQS